MKKFIKDLVEVCKDIWYAFVWCVEAADAIGEMLASKFTNITNNKPTVIEAMPATKEVKRNVVLED